MFIFVLKPLLSCAAISSLFQISAAGPVDPVFTTGALEKLDYALHCIPA